MSRDALRRALRTFLQAFLGLLLPGVFGWLNAVTEWARNQGQAPFPDARSLAYLGVSAIVAGMIAAVTLLWNGIEDAAGRGLLRTVPPKPGADHGGDGGYAIPGPVLVGVLIVAVVVLAVLLL